LLVGLHYLKALHDESDESVVAKWVENPYWQYFCGEETFQHEFPCHPSSLPRRQQVGVEGVEKLLKQVLRTAMHQPALKPSEIAQVHVDTTVHGNSYDGATLSGALAQTEKLTTPSRGKPWWTKYIRIFLINLTLALVVEEVVSTRQPQPSEVLMKARDAILKWMLNDSHCFVIQELTGRTYWLGE
jgi:hypothetical protein